jgi:hypothetical protein
MTFITPPTASIMLALGMFDEIEQKVSYHPQKVKIYPPIEVHPQYDFYKVFLKGGKHGGKIKSVEKGNRELMMFDSPNLISVYKVVSWDHKYGTAVFEFTGQREI